jgi:hypothetical protein
MKKLYIRNQSEEMTLKELFEQFLVAKQCINVSPYTLRFYEGCNQKVQMLLLTAKARPQGVRRLFTRDLISKEYLNLTSPIDRRVSNPI